MKKFLSLSIVALSSGCYYWSPTLPSPEGSLDGGATIERETEPLSRYTWHCESHVRSELCAHARSAAAWWAHVCALPIVEVSDPSEADMLVTQDDPELDALQSGNDWIGVHWNGRIQANDIPSWELEFGLVLHEFGHWLGLPHSDDPKSIMYPQFEGPTFRLPDSAPLLVGDCPGR